ncbi:glucosamine-6-phosphate deaminase [bacterium]|nr:glucosamine-6-phosphate deaminase [bacterium]
MKKIQIGSQEAQVGEVDEICCALADEVEALIQSRAKAGKFAVLGLATGSTPLPFYAELIRRHREEGLSFANVISFNLDEYEGLGRDHERSYWCEMWKNLFDHVDVEPKNVSVPPSLSDDPDRAATEYEAAIQAAGGIDWQLLGIGGEGHIGFNEKGSALDSRTRRVALARKTIIDAAPSFGGRRKCPNSCHYNGGGFDFRGKADSFDGPRRIKERNRSSCHIWGSWTGRPRKLFTKSQKCRLVS